jgi:cold shock CspA family protein
MRGTIKRWLSDRGFGFIESDNAETIFCHTTALNDSRLGVGDRVEFDVVMHPDTKRLKAKNVRLLLA